MGPTISVADGRVTVSGTFDWQRVSTQGIDLRSQSTSYTFSFSAAGTPFDPDFAAPSTGNAVELASDADLRVGDPLVGGVDQWQDVAFGVYNFEEGSLHPDFRDDGVAVDAVWSLVPEGSFDSDQRYIFTIGMNEDFTAIETVSVELQFRDVIVNFLGEVSGYTTSYYHGVDAPAAPISIGTLIGVPTNIPTAGNDVLDYSGESAGQTVNGLAGNDTMIGTQVADTLRGDGGADTIRGNNGWDTLSGGQGWDTLVGGRGNDTLFGGRGNDTLFGGRGNDDLLGGKGNDTLRGDKGQDELTGGQGNDQLTGGTGADEFRFSGAIGQDVITDWGTGADELYLSQNLWSGTRTEAQVVAQFAEVVSGNVVFDFEDGNTITLLGVTTTAGLADAIEFF